MAGPEVWSALQLGEADALLVPRAASWQGQSYLPASRLDQHRASTACGTAGGLRAPFYQKIYFGSCHKHACVQPAASTTKSRPCCAGISGEKCLHSILPEKFARISTSFIVCVQDASELWNHDAIQTAELFQELRLGQTNCLADNR